MGEFGHQLRVIPGPDAPTVAGTPIVAETVVPSAAKAESHDHTDNDHGDDYGTHVHEDGQ